MLETVQFGCLSVAWNKYMRRALNVPYPTHVELSLPATPGVNLASMQIKSRVLKFAHQCLPRDSSMVTCLARHCLRSNLHILGGSMSLIMRKHGWDSARYDPQPINFLSIKNPFITMSIPRPFCKDCWRFIVDILDNDRACFLTDVERHEIMFYLCCE